MSVQHVAPRDHQQTDVSDAIARAEVWVVLNDRVVFLRKSDHVVPKSRLVQGSSHLCRVKLPSQVVGPCGFCLPDKKLLAKTVHDGVEEGRFDVEDVAKIPVSSELELLPVLAKELAPRRC